MQRLGTFIFILCVVLPLTIVAGLLPTVVIQLISAMLGSLIGWSFWESSYFAGTIQLSLMTSKLVVPHLILGCEVAFCGKGVTLKSVTMRCVANRLSVLLCMITFATVPAALAVRGIVVRSDEFIGNDDLRREFTNDVAPQWKLALIGVIVYFITGLMPYIVYLSPCGEATMRKIRQRHIKGELIFGFLSDICTLECCTLYWPWCDSEGEEEAPSAVADPEAPDTDTCSLASVSPTGPMSGMTSDNDVTRVETPEWQSGSVSAPSGCVFPGTPGSCSGGHYVRMPTSPLSYPN